MLLLQHVLHSLNASSHSEKSDPSHEADRLAMEALRSMFFSATLDENRLRNDLKCSVDGVST